MTITIYGIKNCDTMKKAFAWFDQHGVAYEFHDYKKQGVDAPLLQRAVTAQGWEAVLNRKGTTWRALSESTRNAMDAVSALKIAQQNPSIIRRPMIVQGGTITLGFDAAIYNKMFV